MTLIYGLIPPMAGRNRVNLEVVIFEDSELGLFLEEVLEP